MSELTYETFESHMNRYLSENPIQGLSAPAPTERALSLGESVDMASWTALYTEPRQIVPGPRLGAFINSIPGRLLFRSSERAISADEDSVLNYNRMLLEAEPNFFVMRMGTEAPFIRQAIEPDSGQPIPGLWVRPSANNGRPITRAAAEAEARRHIFTQMHSAHLQDVSGGYSFEWVPTS